MAAQIAPLIGIMLAKTTGHNDTARSAAAAAVVRLARHLNQGFDMPSPLKRILHVEDEPGIRAIVKMALEAVGGFTVQACESGPEALIAAALARADLLLLDVMMPGLDGPATLMALRGLPATASTPVIFMTAKVQSAEISRFRAMGAMDVIAKPFDPMELSAQVQRIWDAQG